MSAKRVKRPIGKSSSRTSNFKYILITYAVLILLSATTATIVARRQSLALPDPFRMEQRRAVEFPLYYPSKLPQGMEVDASSLGRVESTIITMRITDGRGSLGRSFTITEQAALAGFNLETFYASFNDKTTFETPFGSATTGTIDNGKTRLVSLIANKETWILIQAPPTVHLDELVAVLENFRTSN